MEDISNTVTTVILFVIGGLASILAYGIRSFMVKTEKTLEYHDSRLDRIENDLDTTIALQKVNQQNIAESLHRMEQQLEKIGNKFEEYDKNIQQFWKDNPNLK